ncbi:MAG: cysteine desulfurase [Fervidicoccaceae archaeon]
MIDLELDVESIRRDFPILDQVIGGRKLVYLDNAATTHKPRQVVERVVEVYYKHYSNVHRGHHSLSEISTELYEEAHRAVARFIGARFWEEIVLTFNTTTAINAIAVPLLEKTSREGRKKVLLTQMEHHSNMLPWRRAAKLLGCEISYIPVKRSGLLDFEKALELLNDDVGVLAISHASNVTGVINDVRLLARRAHEYGIVVVVDGAQSAPHLKINVNDLEVDFFAFSGHKMLAPEGTGVLYGRRELLEELEPWFVGGGAVRRVTVDDVIYEDLPWRFEPGTPDVAGAAGLIEAVKYLERVGMERLHSHEAKLLRLAREILANDERVILYQPAEPEKHTGILAFNVRGINCHVVGKILNDFYGVAVRTGLHCAHPYHVAIGAPDGTVRASFYLYNTAEEIEYFAEAVREIARKYSK